MSITDELRKYAGRLSYEAARKSEHGFSPVAMKLEGIADHIDEEHERVVRERRRSCVYYDPERHYCSCHDFDVSGYVELPKDANGVPIRVGDVLTDGEYTFRVDELTAFGDGSWSIRNEDGNAWAACDVTHHHEPTVEEVMQEMLEQAVGYSDAHTTVALNAIAEYSAKLRLAGDGEEQ